MFISLRKKFLQIHEILQLNVCLLSPESLAVYSNEWCLAAKKNSSDWCLAAKKIFQWVLLGCKNFGNWMCAWHLLKAWLCIQVSGAWLQKKFTVSAAWLQKFWQLNVCFASPDSLCFVCCMRVCVPAKLGSVQLECPGGMCVDVTDIGCAC